MPHDNYPSEPSERTPATMPTTTPTTAPTTMPITIPSPPEREEVTIDLSIRHFTFDRSVISVPAGAQVRINFTNHDRGVLHNVVIFPPATPRQPVFRGEPITGLGSIAYTFSAPATPGTFVFHCENHPAEEQGKFVVH